MRTSRPRSSGATANTPAGLRSSRVASVPSKSANEPEEASGAPRTRSTASTTLPASARTTAARTCTGTPPTPSRACPRMLKCRARPALLIPILPRMPSSVRPTTVCRPPRDSRVCQWALSSTCQSQVWTPKVRTAGAGPSVLPVLPVGSVVRRTRVVHSPGGTVALRARISVRALRAATRQGSSPAPWAMPSISARAPGRNSPTASRARSASSRTRAGVMPPSAKRRSYTSSAAGRCARSCSPRTAPRRCGSAASTRTWRRCSGRGIGVGVTTGPSGC